MPNSNIKDIFEWQSLYRSLYFNPLDMPASPFTDASWMSIFGLVFFTGIYTSDRNLKLLDGTDYGVELVKNMRPVSPFSPQILITTFLFTSPLWFFTVLRNSGVYNYLIYISVGLLFSSLVISSKAAPNSENLSNVFNYVLKWFYGKLDGWIKGLLILAVCYLLSLIPFVKNIGITIADAMFPVVKNKNGSAFFSEVTSGAIIMIIVTQYIRASVLLLNGYILTFIYLMSVVVCWVQYQWFFNEVLQKIKVTELIEMSFITKITLDLLQDIILSLIERTAIKSKN